MEIIWLVTAAWMAVVISAAWRYLRAPSGGRLITYLAVGLAGLAPYLWWLVSGQPPDAYRYVMTAFWLLVAVGSAVWAVRRRTARR